MADYSTRMALAIASDLENSKIPNYDNFSFKETEDSAVFELETESRSTGKTIITQIYVDVDDDGDDRVLNLSALVDKIPTEFSDKIEQLVSVVNEHWCTDGKFIIDDEKQEYLRLFYKQVGYFDEDEIFDEDYEDELEKFLLIIVSGISAFEALATSLYMIVDDGYSVKNALKKNAFIFNLAEKIDDDSDYSYEDDDISENTPDDDTTSIVDDLIDFLREEFEEEPEREFSDLSDDSFEALVNTTRKEAESGDADAQFRLGKIYKSINSNADEKNGFKNDRSSFYWFLKAADQGNGLAMYEVAQAYRQGVAAGYDGKAAIVWCKKAIAAMEGSDNEEEKKAVADAYLDLALLHEIDLTAELDGSTLDKEAAFKYMRESAKRGNYVASFHTADYCMRGNGTAQDENEALVWYERCLELIDEQNINDEEVSADCTAKIKKIKKRQEKAKLLEEQKKEEAVKNLEKKALDEIVANSEGLSYAEYVDLTDRINSLQFKFIDTKPYADEIAKLKNNAYIMENCTDENLSECELDKLQEYKKAVADSTLSDEVKAELYRKIDTQTNIVEAQKLSEMCKDLPELTADALKELKEEIIELGFKEENTKPYLDSINTLYGELIFNDLIGKCTQAELMKLDSYDLDMLLTELEECGKEEATPYINRVSAFIDVYDQLEDDVIELYRQHYKAAHEFAVQAFEKLTLPTYSQTHISCFVKDEDLNSEKIRERLKIFPLNEDFEWVLFLFDDTPTRENIDEGFCITNFGIHHIANFEKTFIPIESITEVKTGKMFETTKISGGNKSFKFSMRDDFSFRNDFANTLMQIIIVAQQRKKKADAENATLGSSYSTKYLECFDSTPIPNDKTLAEAAQELKQEEERKNQELKNLPPPSIEEMIEFIPALVNKYNLRVQYPTIGTQTFTNKLPKAKAAYAMIEPGETPLLLEDHTVFGSAKNGFVLTDKAFYINSVKTGGRMLSEKIESFYQYTDPSTKIHYITMNIKGSGPDAEKLSMSSTLTEAGANKLLMFWTELLEFLNRGKELTTPEATEPEASDTAQTTTQEPALWQCRCGSINQDMFCPKCGTNKSSGTPVWKCSCGNYNVDRFCSQCGTQKP